MPTWSITTFIMAYPQGYPAVAATLAGLYQRLGDSESALKAFDNAIEGEPFGRASRRFISVKQPITPPHNLSQLLKTVQLHIQSHRHAIASIAEHSPLSSLFFLSPTPVGGCTNLSVPVVSTTPSISI